MDDVTDKGRTSEVTPVTVTSCGDTTAEQTIIIDVLADDEGLTDIGDSETATEEDYVANKDQIHVSENSILSNSSNHTEEEHECMAAQEQGNVSTDETHTVENEDKQETSLHKDHDIEASNKDDSVEKSQTDKNSKESNGEDSIEKSQENESSEESNKDDSTEKSQKDKSSEESNRDDYTEKSQKDESLQGESKSETIPAESSSQDDTSVCKERPTFDDPLNDSPEPQDSMESAAYLEVGSTEPDQTSGASTSKERQNQPSSSIRNIFKSSSSVLEESVPASGANFSSSTSSTGVKVKGDVVLVTGASGFLGQHVVKMLQLKAPHVAEIRVLDLEPFTQKLEYEATKPVIVLTGSVTDAEFVASSVRGVHSVIHVAGLVSWGTFPDVEGMKKVNVKGTLNVVNACLQANVARLIYCSTVDVVVGFEPIRGGEEDTTPIPDEFLFPGYPETKYQGERLVLGASAYNRDDGTQLQTLALRVNVMYGELDPHYIINGLRMAEKKGGVLQQVGDGTAMFQQCYVGNAAWAFVCADVAMRGDPRLTSLPFYVPDNTPIQNSFNFMRPYLEARGFDVSRGHLPYGLVYNGLRMTEALAHLLAPITRISLAAQSCAVAYINMDIFFSARKAREVLKYEPIYSPAEARLASLPYYENVAL